MLTLYTYFRSSAAYRVRIALALKGVDYDSVSINLRAGEQHADYRTHNPQGLVPALELPSGETLGQSLAILEYLERTYPTPALLPSDDLQALQVKAMAYHIACDIHPLNNLRVLNYLKSTLHASETYVQTWYAHWIHTGFGSIEQELVHTAGLYAFGDTPTLADCCLVPQVYNAHRFDVDLIDFPTISRLYEYATAQPAFIQAAPKQQADWVD
ncbi:MAG: maleylacetoacetate isomerase [Moraxella sp.]|nr:maleylacetoacetate isomerase [Moraxella sp.]